MDEFKIEDGTFIIPSHTVMEIMSRSIDNLMKGIENDKQDSTV